MLLILPTETFLLLSLPCHHLYFSRKPPLRLSPSVPGCALRMWSLAGKTSTAVSVTSDMRGKHRTWHGNHNTPWVAQPTIPELCVRQQ